jgi:hypothetical protein
VSKGTTHRTVRVEDGLWLPAKAKAAERGENLSDVIREALRAYAELPPETTAAPPEL